MKFRFTEKEQKRYLKKVANSPKKAASNQTERALSAPDSKYLTQRKEEAIKIAKNVKAYKTMLIEAATELKKQGDTQGVEKTLRILVDTWPSQKQRWLDMFCNDESFYPNCGS